MGSLVNGFEYDIFVSYRHNDNRPSSDFGLYNRGGWVTEFVQHLNEELAATIKEPVSVYFDINPHDGLLETHHVDKSLDGKLKCLIFIPILSQTYCDTKSFAWQHEFTAFHKRANEDGLGLDVKLKNGNVTSRILPVKIHDLDNEDKATIEREIGGKLRTIDFIYREPGVNRPLTTSDKKNENLNKTDYRNQINKVANAIKEILQAIKGPSDQLHSSKEPKLKAAGEKKSNRKLLVLSGISLLIIVLAVSLFVVNLKSQDSRGEETKAIAVLAFTDMSPNKDQDWFSDGLSDEIINSLSNDTHLKVIARTSSFYFKNKNVPLSEIAKTLNVSFVLEGSVQRIGDQIHITAQLIRVSDETHVWSKDFDRSDKDLFKVRTEIARNIASKLTERNSPDVEHLISNRDPINITAFENYVKGYKAHHEKYFATSQLSDFNEAESYLLKSIANDPNFAEAYGALADLYDTRSHFGNYSTTLRYRNSRDSLVNLGLQLNPNSLQSLITRGLSFLHRDTPNTDSAFLFLKQAYHLSPNSSQTSRELSYFYYTVGLEELAQKFIKRASELDPLDPVTLNFLGFSQLRLGQLDQAKLTFSKLAELNNSSEAHYGLGMVSFQQGDIEEVRTHLAMIKGFKGRAASLQAALFAMEGKKTEALGTSKPSLRILSMLGMKRELLATMDTLSKSIQGLDPALLVSVKIYDGVRHDPQFQGILELSKKRHQEKLMKYGSVE